MINGCGVENDILATHYIKWFVTFKNVLDIFNHLSAHLLVYYFEFVIHLLSTF